MATGARFVREIFTGVYASDFGVWNTNCGDVIRHQYSIGAQNVKLLFNIVPEAAKYLADRDILDIAKSTVFNNKPDALCVSGLTAGVETDSTVLKRVKEAVPNTVVFANTGCRADNIARQAAMTNTVYVGKFINEQYIANDKITIKEAVANLIAKFGENISVKRFKKFLIEKGIVFGYIHNGGRIGALVKLYCESNSPCLEEVAKEIGMQVAAANPLFLDRQDIDVDILEKIRQAFMKEAQSSGKPLNIIEKMVSGRTDKYYKEKRLLEQTWIKNEDIDISLYLKGASMKIGTDINILGFARFERGQDVE
jgi:hypothetical protein